MKIHRDGHRGYGCNGSPDCWGCLNERVEREMAELDEIAAKSAKARVDEMYRVDWRTTLAILAAGCGVIVLAWLFLRALS